MQMQELQSTVTRRRLLQGSGGLVITFSLAAAFRQAGVSGQEATATVAPELPEASVTPTLEPGLVATPENQTEQDVQTRNVERRHGRFLAGDRQRRQRDRVFRQGRARHRASHVADADRGRGARRRLRARHHDHGRHGADSQPGCHCRQQEHSGCRPGLAASGRRGSSGPADPRLRAAGRPGR